MHPAIVARQTPDKPAIVMVGTGDTVSFAELDERSNRTAHFLRERRCERGDVIAVLMDNSPEFLELVWAAQRAGLYYVCISTQLAPAEIAFILSDSAARLLVAGPRHIGSVAGIARELGIELLAAGASGADFDDLLEVRQRFPATPIADESPGNDMLYSSGTTGRPKGIKPPLPSGGIAEPNGLTQLGSQVYGMDRDTVFLSPAPLYHAAPLRWCMAVQKLGGTVVVMEKFDAAKALEAIARHRVTHAQWVPTHFIRMLKLDRAERERHDLSSLQTVFHAAAPCPVETKQAMLDWWGPIIHEFYGGTEANGLTSIGPEEWLSRPGSVGRAIWGTPKICDEAGDEVPCRTQGTIYFAEGQPFEYHNDPEKTAASRNRHGWTTIGDVGWIDEEGYLYLTDRKSYMIISGGVNIYPQEIEDQLVQHPRIADAAVIGAPDPEMGERVVAVIQPSDWKMAGEAFADEIREWLGQRLGRLKVPRQIDFDRALPRTNTGKLLKRKVRDRYWRAGREAGRDGNPSGPLTAGLE